LSTDVNFLVLAADAVVGAYQSVSDRKRLNHTVDEDAYLGLEEEDNFHRVEEN